VAGLRAQHGPISMERPDALTGLPGRTALRSTLRQHVRSLTPFSVAVIDIDHHDDLPTDDAADAALRTMAFVLQSTLRPGDTVCRLDGAR
ncbi:diguanylate cyclase domain-containing protein, partial [Klebsiella pneumoniae]|uniref:diguanylate cyclase domain-containing protein n=1 Tax=Klebsiella pneumoniae TaxID=573 RepID=UPI0025A0319F